MAAISRFNRRMLRVWVMAIGLWAGLGGLFPAGAHPILQTLVEVRVRPDRLRLHLVMPSSELVFALIEEGRIARPPPGFRRYPDAPAGLVRDYVQGHISARGADGQIYQVSLLRLTGPDTRLADGDPAKDWLADIELKPASGAVSGPVVMTYGVITKEVVNHDAIVSLEEDWQGGVLPGHGRIIGRVARGEQSVTISPGAGGGWRSLVGIVGMGLWHIAEGADHQAFLLMILLTAGLTVKQRRWSHIVTRSLMADTFWRVSAFTLGHSLSLLATSLGWLPPGGQGIEVLIAISVGVSAIHALVPLYPGRESWMAAGFGLIHGMAFASAIRELALPMGNMIAATVAFNIGIELAQLLLVAMVLPILLFMRRRAPRERVARTGLAVAALALSVFWIVQRLA
jgi:hypothetical protein